LINRLALSLIGFVVVSMVWLLQCSGPRPVVQAVTVHEPAQPGLPYQVEVQVRNNWRGGGQLQVQAELRDRASDRRYQGQQNATIKSMESMNVLVEVDALPGDYEPHVEVEYPPR
jgi:hypothetical protein